MNSDTNNLPIGAIRVGAGLTDRQKSVCPQDMTTQADRLRETAGAMERAFTWDATTEGFDFWYSIYERLHEMSDAFKAQADAVEAAK